MAYFMRLLLLACAFSGVIFAERVQEPKQVVHPFEVSLNAVESDHKKLPPQKIIDFEKSNIFYALYDGEREIGYLLGSFHVGLSPADYGNIRQELERYVASADTVYMEIKFPVKHDQMPFGVEKAVLELLDKKENKDYRSFESILFQLALLSRIVWCGDKVAPLPWTNYDRLQKHPVLHLIISRLCAGGLLFYNQGYNLVKKRAHSKAVAEFEQQQKEMLIDLFTDYKNNQIKALSQEERSQLMMEERNHSFVKEIMKDIKTDPDKLSLYVMGASHLPGEDGVINLLQQYGIALEPLFMTLS